MVRTVVLPMLWILLTGAALGLCFNALRGQDGIEIGRAYFAALAGAPPAGPGSAMPAVNDTWDRSRAPTTPDALAYRRAVADGIRMLTVHEAYEYFLAARATPERVAFLDAREDSRYQDGHIPGALQVYYYYPRRSVEPVLFLLEKVPFLVVYCESVSCDDAFLLCKILEETYGIPKDRFRLFFGGMVQWRAYELPVAQGSWPW